MSEELKACPFCGCEVEAPRSRPSSADQSEGYVAFLACYCGGYSATAHQTGKGSTEHEAVQDVIAKWNRRTLPQPAAVEAVEVVEVVAITNRGVCYWQAPHLLDLLPNGTQLMTVAQHNRIMAATVPAGCKVVPVELLERCAQYTPTIEKQEDRARALSDLRAILEVKP